MRLRSIALAFVSALILAGCNAQGEVKRETPPRPVLVAEIHYAPRTAERILPGVVKARTESDLGFRVSGKIARRKQASSTGRPRSQGGYERRAACGVG